MPITLLLAHPDLKTSRHLCTLKFSKFQNEFNIYEVIVSTKIFWKERSLEFTCSVHIRIVSLERKRNNKTLKRQKIGRTEGEEKR